MRTRKTLLLSLSAIVLTATLAGCPQQGTQTFEVWLVNASKTNDITSAEIVNDQNNAQRAQLLQDDLDFSTTRVISGVDATLFEGNTVTIQIVVDALVQGGGGSRVPVNVAERIIESIDPGDVVPIIVFGDHSAEMDAVHAPLDDQSKLLETINNLARK